ncbi:MAG: hypothetical protein NTY74_13775 [Ignavibacteriae bacterium]|nr:hypothetical protein [Ignavibacteriota bacterium]
MKVKALLSSLNCNPVSELNDKEAKMVMEIYESIPACSNIMTNKDTNRFYGGCVMEISSNTNIEVFDGYAILNNNNVKDVRVDKDNRLEKQLLKNLNISPMMKSLIFGFSQNAVIQ